MLVAYFFAAIGLLAARYWILPNADQYRPHIAALLSRELGIQVEIGSIQAQWYGLNAALELKDISVSDAFGVTRLAIPEVEAVLSWRSIYKLKPVFRYLGVEGIAVMAHRQADGSIRIAGFDLPPTGSDSSTKSLLESPVMAWFLDQGRVNLTDATIIWVDQLRGMPPVALRNVSVTLDNGLLSHRLSARAALPPTVGTVVELSARIDRPVSSTISALDLGADGELYLSIPALRPQAVAPWVDIPNVTGNYALRAWLTLKDGKLAGSNVNLSGTAVAVRGNTEGALEWRADALQARIGGVLALFLEDPTLSKSIASGKRQGRLMLQFDAQNAWLSQPAPGMGDLSLDDIKLALTVNEGLKYPVSVSVENLELANADGVMAARGRWTQQSPGASGALAIKGTLARFKLASLHRYLPNAVGEETREWIKDAFLAGIVPQASFEVNGPLDDFPFAKGGGVFRVDGVFQDWSLDYAPGWPKLLDLVGTVSLDRDRISARASAGALGVTDGRRLALERVRADLVDMEGSPRLTLDTAVRAAADSYVGVVLQTQLKEYVPDFVKTLTVQGEWSMPLSLNMAIDDIDNIQFKAELNPNMGSLRFGEMPEVTALQGIAVFTESGFTSRGLRGTLLGGEVALSGEGTEFSATGSMRWADVAKFSGSPLVRDWFSGQLPYKANLKLDPAKGLVVTVDSTLRGTAIKLPAPLGKAANSNLKTQLVWQGAVKEASVDVLTLRMDNGFALQARTNLKPSKQNPAVFDAVSLGIGTKPSNLSPGLRIDAAFGLLTGNDWSDVVGAVMAQANAPSKAQPLFPDLRQANISAKSLRWTDTVLDEFNGRLVVSAPDQHELSLKSVQTTGDIKWRTRAGKIDGVVTAKFNKLDIGSKGPSATKAGASSPPEVSLPKDGALSQLPAVDLTIDSFTLYGSQLGTLQVVGKSSADSRHWDISMLRIENPYAELTATGVCRFSEDPGVSLKATLQIKDLGQLSTLAGQPDRVRKGHGELTADINWREFPWRFSYEKLSGKATVNLNDGVFDHVNSRSARMLELLSLQSINRFFSLNANRDETFSKGFPWNSIEGDFLIDKGVVDTQNLSIKSPVALISMKGGSNLVNETWNLNADVRPNLDLSGAAVATGFIVNPLVGVGALVGQYLLKKPVEAALSARYQVTGPWEDPHIKTAGNDKSRSETPNQVEPGF
jgi:uncharacterized protein (TIGR02099 family)